jgi:cell division septation protein DedD
VRPTELPSRDARPVRRRRLLTLLTPLATLLLPVSVALAAPPTVDPGPAVERLSPWQGQQGCDPEPKPGVAAFRDLVLATYPGTGDSGIARQCHVGGSSEHKEGRAWDWRVNTSRPADVEAATDLLDWLLAEDRHGNTAAMARRLGVMYVIWDRQIWKSYQADRGWQPYTGASPHTDHVHVSFSWAGALKETSYWTGEVAPVRESPVRPTASPTPGGTATPRPSGSATPRPTAAPTTAPRPTAAPTPTPAPTGTPRPTTAPTTAPTPTGTPRPTTAPTTAPTTTPTAAPSAPSGAPGSSARPTPTASPTASPTPAPTGSPTASPSPVPVPTGTPVDRFGRPREGVRAGSPDPRQRAVDALPGPWRRH